MLPVQHGFGPESALRVGPRRRSQSRTCRCGSCWCRGRAGGDVAAVLDAVKPLVALLAQADDPQNLVAQALQHASASTPDLLVAAVAAAVTDRALARTTLTFAGVLNPNGSLTAVALQRLAQAQVLLEVHSDHRQPRWDLVLTVPSFLHTSFTE